jgi:putative spermidine/putrescine transport system ATP-binding protein
MNNVAVLMTWVESDVQAVPQKPLERHGHDAIVIRGLCKSYDGPMVVDQVEFTVENGEFVTLLGPSGSGKTSTLMMIAGFEQPTGGDILLQGRSIVDVPARYRDLGIVFQSYALFPHMSVLENVAFPLRMRKVGRAERRQRAAEMLERVDLGAYKDRLPRQLSGGQQQRVALARALVFNPQALLLDEPLGALDKRLRDELQLEIKAIQKKVGVSIVFVTHDQNEAMMMSDKIVVMNRGRVEQIGAPNEVYNHPKTSFVATFLGETNLIPCSVDSTNGDRAIITTSLCSHRCGATISTQLPENGNYGISIRPERLKLVNDTSGVDGCLEGHVLSHVFLGASHRIVVKAADQNIVLSIPDGASVPPLEPGDKVKCGWNVCDAQLLSMDTKSAPHFM